MVAAIQIVIFLVAFFAKQKYVTLILAIAALFLPDEIPAVDEILMIAAAARAFYGKKEHKDGQDLTNDPPCITMSGANDDSLSGGDE